MANKTIQQLDAITTADASDVLAIYDVSENGTNKITAANLLNTTTISGLTTTAKTIPAAINELNNDLDANIIKTLVKTGTTTQDGTYQLHINIQHAIVLSVDIPGYYVSKTISGQGYWIYVESLPGTKAVNANITAYIRYIGEIVF